MIVLDPVTVLVSTTELGQVCPAYLGQSSTIIPSFLMPCTTQSASNLVARVPRNADLNPRLARTLQLLLAFPPRTYIYAFQCFTNVTLSIIHLVLVLAPLDCVLCRKLVHNCDLVKTDQPHTQYWLHAVSTLPTYTL